MRFMKNLFVLLVFVMLVACSDDESDLISRPDTKEISSSVLSSSIESSCSANSSSSVTSKSSSSQGDGGSHLSSSGQAPAAMTSSSVKSSSSLSEGYVDPSTIIEGTLIDSRDGQSYKTVKIGNQWWMAENLNYAFVGVPYSDGDYTSDSTSWCYNDSAEYCDKYGRLYTWAAAMDSAGLWSTNGMGCGYGKICFQKYPVRGICPEGWHLPDTTEFRTLFNDVGGSSSAGDMLKSVSGWNDDGNGSDSYSFAALPAGVYGEGSFKSEGISMAFWSSNNRLTEQTFTAYLNNANTSAALLILRPNFGFSVRCLKD